MAWSIWAILVLVLLILETITVDFFFMMLGFGALFATATAWFTGSLTAQIIVFAIVSVIALFLVRPWVKRRINNDNKIVSNISGLLGKTGIALTEVNILGGRVKVAGEVWSAKTLAGIEIPAQAEIEVAQVDGAHLIVLQR